MNMAEMNDVIKGLEHETCDAFSNFLVEVKEYHEELESFEDEIIEFFNERLAIASEEELSELTDYERENLTAFINTLL